MTSIKFIFFDLGDTLIDMSLSHEAMGYAIKSNLKDLDRIDGSILLTMWERHWHHVFSHNFTKDVFYTITDLLVISLKEVLSKHDINIDNQVLIEIVEQFWKFLIQNCKLFPDVQLIIPSLIDSGYTLGLITNGDKDVTIEILKKHNLWKTFQVKIISSVIKEYKPSVRLYQEAIKKANCLATEILYIGDSEVDIQGAKAVGMFTVILNRRNSISLNDSITVTIHPDFQINSLLELPKIIKNIDSFP